MHFFSRKYSNLIFSKQAGRKARQDKKAKKANRSDKGRPRWTAYLLWSSRRRKEIQIENENFTFAQVGKQVSLKTHTHTLNTSQGIVGIDPKILKTYELCLVFEWSKPVLLLMASE
jgi:hypothetical protein